MDGFEHIRVYNSRTYPLKESWGVKRKGSGSGGVERLYYEQTLQGRKGGMSA